MLKDKTALITGSTSGIGLGIARALAAQGANIMLNGFGPEAEIEAARAAIAKDYGVQVLYDPADMSKPEQIRALCERTAQEFGPVDILVNNAGIQHVSPVEQFPEEKWDAILAINLSSAFHTIKALLPGMRKRGWGRIINVASAHGLTASPYKAAYIVAKHGIMGLTKTVALETARDNITCNAICPGYVLTPLVENQISAQAKAHNLPEDEVVTKVILDPQPSKKFIQIEEVAALAVFLCDERAQGVTGADMKIDGGWTAGKVPHVKS